jgi:hypothetical protein
VAAVIAAAILAAAVLAAARRAALGFATAAAAAEHGIEQLEAKTLGTDREGQYQRSEKRGPIH